MDLSQKLDWKETGTTAGLRVPLIFTRSKYYSQLEVGNFVGITNVSSFTNNLTHGDTLKAQSNQRFYLFPYGDLKINGKLTPVNLILPDQLNGGILLSNHFYATYLHALKLSYRDFNSKWAQYLYFDYFNTPYRGDFAGSLLTAKAIAFFPGLFNHHSLFFRGGFQNAGLNSDPANYAFRNQLFKPRGYSYPNDKTFTSLSANYQFPLWYPDIALGPILNVQRVKANLFYDYGQGQHKDYLYSISNQPLGYYFLDKANYNSAGIELTFDINVMRLLQQIEVGFRLTQRNANAYNTGGMVSSF